MRKSKLYKFRFVGEENPDIELSPQEAARRLTYYMFMFIISQVELGKLDIWPYKIEYREHRQPP